MMMPPGYGPGMPPPGVGPGWGPPPMYPPPPKQGGFARGIFITLATTIFGASLMLNLYLLLFAGLTSGGAGGAETSLTSGEADQKIAVVPVEGLIDGNTAVQVKKWLKALEKDENYKGLVLQVETPGGYVTPSDEIHYLLADFKKKREEKSGKKFPVAVSMGAMATSGGYYVSAGADQIFAQPTTLTGNIGVLMPRYNLKALADKWGVSESTVTAPEKGFKNAGSMFAPETPEDKVYLQNLINQSYTRFTSVVDAGRKGKLKAARSEIYDGRAFTAQDAIDNGLVDQIGYLDDAVAWVKTQAGLSKPTVIKYQRRTSIFDLMAEGSSALPAPSGKSVTLNVQINPELIHELSAPRVMYLWRGE